METTTPVEFYAGTITSTGEAVSTPAPVSVTTQDVETEIAAATVEQEG